MKKSIVRFVHDVRALLLIASVTLAGPTAALAQQKFKTPDVDPEQVSKYTVQHTLDVGDVPGHQIRIATLHTKNSDKAGEFDGVKVLETTAWLTSDYINGSGRFTTYAVASMANGDKIYSRGEGMTHTAVAADGSRKTSFSTVTTYIGGTGRFATLRGSARGTGATDFKSGFSTSSSTGEYWFDK